MGAAATAVCVGVERTLRPVYRMGCKPGVPTEGRRSAAVPSPCEPPTQRSSCQSPLSDKNLILLNEHLKNKNNKQGSHANFKR